MATVRPGWLCPSASVTVGERISWRFEGDREGCGETTAAVGVSGVLLGCKLNGTWPGVGVGGEGAVEVETASSEVGAARCQLELGLGLRAWWPVFVVCVFVISSHAPFLPRTHTAVAALPSRSRVLLSPTTAHTHMHSTPQTNKGKTKANYKNNLNKEQDAPGQFPA